MISALLSAAIIVNELMAANLGEAMSPATNFDSWIELYNPTDEDIRLGGMYLSDDESNLKRWKMPDDVGTIPAKGFQVIWLGSNDIRRSQAPFKLDCDGGVVCLSDAYGSLIVSQRYPKAISHTAYARKTDGGEDWGWTSTPTPGESNASAPFATERLAAPEIDTDSRLFTGQMAVHVAIPEGARLMYSLDGSLPMAPVSVGGGGEQSPWKEMVKNGNCEGKDESCLSYRDGDSHEDKSLITDGVGYDGSRGIKVHAVANPEQEWDTQFFVYTPDHVWNSGDRYRFRIKVKADHACHVSTQTHRQPHSYIYWSFLEGGLDVTTEWKEFVFEGTVTDEQIDSNPWWPSASEFQTIAFNLNELRGVENNFYFDDISWEAATGDIMVGQALESTDGNFTINNTTNLTVRLFRDGYLPSVPVTRSYIKTSQRYTCPVVSIVGDERYFKDPMWGIDVEGNNGKTGNGREDKPVNWNMDWDRPVNFSYLTPDGKMAFNQDANISVSGGWTRMIEPRSMKLKANKTFDGKNRFDYAFFPQKPFIRNKALVLRNGGNDVWEHHSRFMDPALETIIQRSGIDLDVQSYVQVAEYINGEFRGVVNLREPNNDKFVDANFGYDDEEIDMFENFSFKNGNSDALKRIYELGSRIQEPGAYDELRQLLDIDELTNYMAVELFVANNDWPDNNVKAYRSQDHGRYRFISFDLDYAFKRDDPFSALGNYKGMPFITFFINLLGHDEYRRKFIDTYCLIAGSVFEKDIATAIVNEMADAMRPMSQLDGCTPDNAANKIKSKLKTQQEKMLSCLEKYQPMKLSGVTRQSVTLTADTEGARLFVDDIEVPYARLKGYLYAPARLRAQAPAGYRFDGWKKGAETLSKEASIDLPSDKSMTLTASFVPLTAGEKAAEGLPPVRINEVSAANGIFVNDYWKRNDWVELYNTTDEDIDAEGMYLSDHADNPRRYQISKTDGQVSTIVPAHGFLVIWCDKEDPVTQLHAPFKLDADEGEVVLTAADGSWSDRLSYTTMRKDETAGRWPDGCGDVFMMNVPTIARPNLRSSYLTVIGQTGTSGIEDAAADVAGDIAASYSAGTLIVRGQGSEQVQIVIHNLAGQTVAYLTAQLQGGYAEASLNQLPHGAYVAVVTSGADGSGNGHGGKAICKFIRQ